jgi:endonuclease/exonuclease/phosphatase family metal-dependent hydrolase
VRQIRVVTLNMWNDRHEPARRMQAAIAQLRALQPDVIGMQEVVDSSGFGNQARLVAEALDARWVFDAVDDERPGGAVGNAIVSRFPIGAREGITLPTGPGDPRRALFAELMTPDGSLPFFTCHLSWELWQAPRREAQVLALDDFVHAHATELPAVVTGDFNATPESSVVMYMTGRASLAGRGTYYRDAYARRHPHDDGYTYSQTNPYSERRLEWDRRIDYVFVGQIDRRDRGVIVESSVVLDHPAADGTWPSDHFGVMAVIG